MTVAQSKPCGPLYRKRIARQLLTSLCICVVFGVPLACGGDEGDTGHLKGGGASGAGAAAGSGNGMGAGLGGLGNGSGGFGPSPGTGASTGDGGFEECAGTLLETEAIALDMYVMLDHTGSMGSDCPLNVSGAPSDTSKWCYATHALAQFFMSGSAAGNRAALQFMSLEGGVCQGGPDNTEAFAAVDLTPLPVAAESPLVSALDTDSPTSGLGTQIEAALHGIATFTEANRSPGRTMIGVFITDGDPNGCDENVDRLSDIIRNHYEATGIKTFVIGMTGATLSNLQTLAEGAGAPAHSEYCGAGVDSCNYWSVGDGDPVAFVDALQQIQGLATLPCEYGIPEPPLGQTLDHDLVNVNYTQGSAEERLLQVTDASACDTQQGGWFYDKPTSPTSIRLCEASCNLVKAGGSGSSVHVAYGCATQTKPPE